MLPAQRLTRFPHILAKDVSKRLVYGWDEQLLWSSCFHLLCGPALHPHDLLLRKLDGLEELFVPDRLAGWAESDEVPFDMTEVHVECLHSSQRLVRLVVVRITRGEEAVAKRSGYGFSKDFLFLVNFHDWSETLIYRFRYAFHNLHTTVNFHVVDEGRD